MRIVGGLWRGRSLVAPPGRATRPTQERVREALASMAASALGLSFEGLTVLDPFCGSGALSLELLSRGAQGATLIDKNPQALSAAQRNVETLKAQESVTLCRGDAWKTLRVSPLDQAPFAVVVLDPPYATSVKELESLLELLGARHVLSESAIVVHEHARDSQGLSAGALASLRFCQKNSRSYGDTTLDLWVRTQAQESFEERCR